MATEAKVIIKGEDQLSPSVKSAQNSLTGLQGVSTKLGATFKSGLKIAAITAGLKKLVEASIACVKSFTETESALTKLDTTLKAAGSSLGMTTGELRGLADSFSQVTSFSNEAVMGVQQLFIATQSVSKDMLPEATEAALDMASALGQDASSAAERLAQALQDPAGEVEALREAFIFLDEDQIKNIETLQDQNKLYEAQQIILDEISETYGGLARSVAEVSTGKLEQISNVFEDIKSGLGEGLFNAIAPALDYIYQRLVDISDWINGSNAYNAATGYNPDLSEYSTESLRKGREQAQDWLDGFWGDWAFTDPKAIQEHERAVENLTAELVRRGAESLEPPKWWLDESTESTEASKEAAEANKLTAEQLEALSLSVESLVSASDSIVEGWKTPVEKLQEQINSAYSLILGGNLNDDQKSSLLSAVEVLNKELTNTLLEANEEARKNYDEAIEKQKEAEEKAQKEREKAEEKAQREREKAEEKAQRERKEALREYERIMDEFHQNVENLINDSDAVINDSKSEVTSSSFRMSEWVANIADQQQEIRNQLNHSNNLTQEEGDTLRAQLRELQELRTNAGTYDLINGVGNNIQNGITDMLSNMGMMGGVASVVIGPIMDTLQPLVDIIDSITNPLTIIQQILQGFVDVLAPLMEAVVKPLTDFFHLFGELIAGLFVPLLERLYPIIWQIAEILEWTIMPIFDILTPILELISMLLTALYPVLDIVAVATITVGSVFGWLGDWIKHIVTTIWNWLRSINIFGWHPFGSGYTETHAPKDLFSYIGDNLAEYRGESNKVKGSNLGDDEEEEDTSTKTSITSASYSGSTTVHINIYQQAPVVGDGGMSEFARMIRREFEELDYYGTTT